MDSDVSCLLLYALLGKCRQTDGFSAFYSSVGVKFVKCLDVKEAIDMALL